MRAMTLVSVLRPRPVRVLLAALALAIASLFAVPWGLYAWGLSQFGEQRPALPGQLLSTEQQTALWQQMGADGSPAMVMLDPVSYVMSAASQSPPPPSTAVAWRVASSFTRQTLGAEHSVRLHIASTAMAIWLTRHHSLAQLLSQMAATAA
jgi:hypothetical protein